MAVQKEQKPKPRIARPGDSRVLSILGSTLALHAVGEDTQGAWALMEYTLPANFDDQTLHFHGQTLEALYVLEGTLQLHLGDEWVAVPVGSFVLIPPAQVHSLINSCDAPTRFLMLVSPAGLEHYFEEVAGLVAREAIWPPVDSAKLETLSTRHDHHAIKQSPQKKEQS